MIKSVHCFCINSVDEVIKLNHEEPSTAELRIRIRFFQKSEPGFGFSKRWVQKNSSRHRSGSPCHPVRDYLFIAYITYFNSYPVLFNSFIFNVWPEYKVRPWWWSIWWFIRSNFTPTYLKYKYIFFFISI